MQECAVDYDPTQYLGSARHYLLGRPPYSAELGVVLATELGLDGTGRLVDVGSGPGVLAVQLAGLFEHITAIEPDPEMLAIAREHARGSCLHWGCAGSTRRHGDLARRTPAGVHRVGGSRRQARPVLPRYAELSVVVP